MPRMIKLRKELSEARACTDQIFGLFEPQALYERPIPERHRVIFYLGHLEAFDWNQICRWSLGEPSFHKTFDELFEAGIDPVIGTLPSDLASDWPSVQEVKKYNTCIRQKVDKVLDVAPQSVVQMAIEHRWMHAETTTYILHHAKLGEKLTPILPKLSCSPIPVHAMIEIPEGIVTLGQDLHEGFGWDNEFGQHEIKVEAFMMSKYKVTNRQYLDFVEDGASPPSFWVKREKQWFLKTMFEEIPLPPDWPVYVSLNEARQYAKWADLSLPTEMQFHRAAYGTCSREESVFPWGNEPPNGVTGNFNFAHWDPISVTATPLGDSSFGIAQLVGNGWEWTSTRFYPFKGFQPYPTYPDYSSRFFDDDHYIVKGASATTASCLLRRSFRNWFRQGYPHAYAGFRCVKNF